MYIVCSDVYTKEYNEYTDNNYTITSILSMDIWINQELFPWFHKVINNFPQKVSNLCSTDDGEPSEESHGASDETQLGLGLDLLVPLDVVKGRRVKVDLH